MSWFGESRRHALAGMGIKTVINDNKRLDVSKFVAKGVSPDELKEWIGPEIHGETPDGEGTHYSVNSDIEVTYGDIAAEVDGELEKVSIVYYEKDGKKILLYSKPFGNLFKKVDGELVPSTRSDVMLWTHVMGKKSTKELADRATKS